MVNHHPTRRLTAPDGTRVRVDTMLAPLIKALWAAGYDTCGSCQDLGESLTASADSHTRDYWKRGLTRHADHWKGYALIEMHVEYACMLLDTIKDTPQFEDRMHWASPDGWQVSCPVIPGWEDDGESELSLYAQIRFPNDQIDDLIKVLTAS